MTEQYKIRAEFDKWFSENQDIFYWPAREALFGAFVGGKLTLPAAAAPSGWLPIDTSPTSGKEMFVVRAFNVDITGRGDMYTSDAYAVWRRDVGTLARWPHAFHPTHWMPLPAAPDA